MVIAAGPADRQQHHGADPADADRPRRPAGHRASSFTVTFDRPINPPGGTRPSFTPADVQVFYHDTTNGDASVPLNVAERHPGRLQRRRARQQVRLHRVHGHLQPPPGGGSSGIDYTGTYSYLIAPDDGHGNPIVSPIRVLRHRPGRPAGHRPGRVDQRAPADPASVGHGRHGHRRRHHDLDAQIAPAIPTRLITGITVNLSLTTPATASDHRRSPLTAPDGQTPRPIFPTASSNRRR